MPEFKMIGELNPKLSFFMFHFVPQMRELSGGLEIKEKELTKHERNLVLAMFQMRGSRYVLLLHNLSTRSIFEGSVIDYWQCSKRKI